MAAFKNFFSYLKKKDVIALAIGVMVANTAQTLTKSLVEDIVKPVADPIVKRATGSKDLSTWKVSIGPVNLRIGNFIKNMIEFVIIGLVIVNISNMASKYF